MTMALPAERSSHSVDGPDEKLLRIIELFESRFGEED